MTKLEKMLSEMCHLPDCDVCVDYDQTEGHFHIEPAPPNGGFFEDVTWHDDPPEMFIGNDSYGIPALIEIRDWLNEVLKEVVE